MRVRVPNLANLSSSVLRLCLVLALVTLATVSQARPPFLELYKTYYKIDPESPNGKAGCKNCHAEGTRRNPYGKALSKLVKMSSDGKLTEDMLKQVEKEDSDGDGWTNGDEIRQGYLPGDPNSHPEGKPGDPPKPKKWGSASGSSSVIPTHGFHPSFVHFPIGLFLFGVILELLGLKKRNPEMGRAAFLNLVGALVSLVIVAPTGVAAWLLGGHKLEGTMLVHLLLAIGSLVLMAATLAARKKLGNDSKAYLVVLVLTAVVIGLTGHFGGVLVFG